jgi:hypothetical protein
VRMAVFKSGSVRACSETGCFSATTTYRRSHALSDHLCSRMCLTAKSDRKMSVRMTRKMQVPAYPDVDDGAQPLEYKGVAWLLKNAIVISEASMVSDVVVIDYGRRS